MFVLLEQESGRIWGMYDDTNHLLSTYLSVTELKPSVRLAVNQYIINTTIVRDQFNTKESILKLCGYTPPRVADLDETTSTSVPREILAEVERVKERFSLFTGNMIAFRRLLDQGVITLDSPAESVPELFRDKFEIYRDIVRLEVPDNEAFTYFMDRFRYQECYF